MRRLFSNTAKTLVAGLLCAVCMLALYAATRKPLQKSVKELPAPRQPEKVLLGQDDKGEPVYYDLNPRVVPLGGGRYAFKWMGLKGQELTEIYSRPDAIDVVVEAALQKVEDGRHEFNYKVRVLRTSPRDLSGYYVQTFSPTAKAAPLFGVRITKGPTHNAVPKEFSFGRWFSFGLISDQRKVTPGQAIELVILAADLPGVVECRANASIVRYSTASEELPDAFLDVIVRHDAWPRGYTIGPDERLAKMSLEGRLKYLVEHLPQMLELGWIENQKVMDWYEANLKAGKAAEVRARAEIDFKRNLITSEVLALMTYLTR